MWNDVFGVRRRLDTDSWLRMKFEGERSALCLLSGRCRPQLWSWPTSPLRFNSVGGKHTNTHRHAGSYIYINLTFTHSDLLETLLVKHHFELTLCRLKSFSDVIQSLLQILSHTEQSTRKKSTLVGSRNNEILTRSIYTGMYLNPCNLSMAIWAAAHQTVKSQEIQFKDGFLISSSCRGVKFDPVDGGLFLCVTDINMEIQIYITNINIYGVNI